MIPAEVKTILKQIKDKDPLPLYLLHGEESYYIDLVAKNATENLLEEHERDFNQTVVYGKDVDTKSLLAQLKQYPMMADYQLVILKEAQDLKDWSTLENYLEQPLSSTVFLVCYKHKKADARKKFFKHIKKNGVVFESKRLYENQVDAWIKDYLKKKKMLISPKAALLLVDFLGADLSKIVKELDKLSIVIPEGTTINEDHIEKNIGISKDYNPFELANAIAKRDIQKAHKIIYYFEQNPKATHITVLIPSIFSFFDRLMKAHFLRVSDPQQLQSSLRMNYYAAQETFRAMQIYKPKKIAKNIALLQTYDLKSKGINRGPGTDADLLRELIFQLMH